MAGCAAGGERLCAPMRIDPHTGTQSCRVALPRRAREASENEPICLPHGPRSNTGPAAPIVSTVSETKPTSAPSEVYLYLRRLRCSACRSKLWPIGALRCGVYVGGKQRVHTSGIPRERLRIRERKNCDSVRTLTI